MGGSFGGTRPLSEPPERATSTASCEGIEEVNMAQGIIIGVATFVMSVGVVLYAQLRRPAYVRVRRASREQSRVR